MGKPALQSPVSHLPCRITVAMKILSSSDCHASSCDCFLLPSSKAFPLHSSKVVPSHRIAVGVHRSSQWALWDQHSVSNLGISSFCNRYTTKWQYRFLSSLSRKFSGKVILPWRDLERASGEEAKTMLLTICIVKCQSKTGFCLCNTRHRSQQHSMVGAMLASLCKCSFMS